MHKKRNYTESKSMITVGRVCVKIAGRDAGKKCVVVESVDDTFVLVDGETRRRKCNISHLEPLKQTLDIAEGADHSEVVDAFKTLGIEIREKKPKVKAPRAEKPKAEPKAEKAEKPKKEKKAAKK
jgi:large subunit ribosomal protein L14e